MSYRAELANAARWLRASVNALPAMAPYTPAAA